MSGPYARGEKRVPLEPPSAMLPDRPATEALSNTPPAEAAPGVLSWRVLDGKEAGGAFGEEWGRLSAGTTPLADAKWSSCFMDAFAGARLGAALHALYEDDRLVAVLPLLRTGGVVRAWASLDNEHSPYWLFPVAQPSPRIAREILSHLLADADHLFFRRFHVESPMCRLLVEEARAAGLPCSLLRSEAGDAVVALPRPWEAFRSSLSANLYQDTTRKMRKLEKLGALRLEMVGAGPGLEAELAVCFDLEERGWKGAEGSPMRAHPHTHRFYSELARGLGARGRFMLCLLKLDGRVIAFEYWLRGGGHIEMLKISFDPEYGKFSPGHVLRFLALRREIEEGESHACHLGRPSAWKARWATSVEPLCSLRIYAPTLRGRSAWLAGPVLRGALKRSALAQRARAAFERWRRR